MSTQLLVNVFTVGPLNAGESVTLPHGLLSRNEPVAPTLIQPDRGTPIVVDTVTDTDVTFTNNGAAPAEAVFRCERGLSNEVDAEALTPSYWQGVEAGGGGGGVVAVNATAPLASTNPAGPVTTISLNNSGVTAGSYGNAAAATQSLMPQVTVDALGRVTAASQASITIGGSAAKTYVDNAAAAAQANAEAYAQTLAFGIASKAPAHLATTGALPAYTATTQTLTANAPYAAFPNIDGHPLAVGERLLVKNETAADEPNNGIYELTTAGDALNPWVLTRTADANTAQELCGSLVSVEIGTANGGTLWLFAANANTFDIGVDPVIWESISVPNATTTSAGAVQLAAGLGGAGTAYNTPKLDLDHATSGTLAVARGGTGATALTGYGAVVMNAAGTAAETVAPSTAGNVLTSNGTSWTSAAPAVQPVEVDQVYYVATDGNDTTGTGAINKPFATIQKAHDVALLDQPAGTKVRISVAPGTYATGTKISITRYDTFISGAGCRPEEQVTKISDPIEIDCSTATDLNNQQVSVDGCFVAPSSSFTEPAIGVIGTGQFSVIVTNSYLTTDNAAATASAFSITNAGARAVLWNNTATVQSATAAAPVINFAGGNNRLADTQIFHGSPVLATATSKGIAVSGASYLFADRILVETRTNQYAITLAGTAFGGTFPAKAAISNAGITTTGTTSNGIQNTATALPVLVTDTLFTVPAGRECITAAAGCPTLVSQLTFVNDATDVLNIALPVYNDEIHGEMFLPSLASPSLPLKVDADRKVITGQIDLATEVTGTLPATNGGTAQNTYAKGDLLYASAANTLSTLPIGTTDGWALTVNTALGVPEWRAIPATTLQGAYNAGKTIVLTGGPAGKLDINFNPVDPSAAAFSIRGASVSSISSPDLEIGQSSDNTFVYGSLYLDTAENILSNGGTQPTVALAEGTIVFRNSSQELEAAVATSSVRILGVVGAGAAGTNGYVQSLAGTQIIVRFTGTPAYGDAMYLSATAGVAQSGPPSSGLPYYLGTFLSDEGGGLALIDWNPLPPVPYDLAGSVAGEPPALAKCFYFVATRRCVITATGHRAGANTVPSANTTFTVYAGAVNIGTFTVPVGGSVSFSLTETVVNAGTVVSVESPALLNGLADLYFTFSAVTNA